MRLRLGPMSRKKAVILGAIFVLIVAATVLAISRLTTPRSGDVESERGMIKLEKVTKDMHLKDGDPISGSFKPQSGANIYYLVTTDDKKVLGSGNISAGAGNKFSRNLAIQSQDYRGKQGQIEVYLQDTAGKRLDGVILPVTF